MLISFSVGNFLSFKDVQTLSMEADSFKEQPANLHVPYLYNAEERLLKSVAIYGHNSHGKSNLIRAFQFFHRFIFNSFTQGQLSHKIDGLFPFRLNESMLDKPSFFEIIFLVKNVKYRYKVLTTSTAVLQEELHYSQYKVRENYLFERQDQTVKFSKQWSKENHHQEDALTQFAQPHILLLSVLLSQNKLSVINDIKEWLSNSILVPDNYYGELAKARAIYSDPQYTSLILKFIAAADLGFTTIFDKLDKLNASKGTIERGFLNIAFEKEIKEFELYTNHEVYNQDRKLVRHVEFDLLMQESSGSIKYFILVCLLAYAIKNSRLILIDELDARFHSLLLEMLISSFHNPKINPINSQLIFTTHNTHLLDEQMRRDQMVVIEKNEWGESSILRAHTSGKPIKIGKSLEREYRKGKIGGISKKIKDNLGPTLFD